MSDKQSADAERLNRKFVKSARLGPWGPKDPKSHKQESLFTEDPKMAQTTGTLPYGSSLDPADLQDLQRGHIGPPRPPSGIGSSARSNKKQWYNEALDTWLDQERKPQFGDWVQKMPPPTNVSEPKTAGTKTGSFAFTFEAPSQTQPRFPNSTAGNFGLSEPPNSSQQDEGGKEARNPFSGK